MKNCLKCPIYWNDTVHECVCEQCNNKDFSEAYVDICHEMPPLVMEEKKCGN
jgi:hypothetical protein